jgi:hypothetical protein
MNTREKNKLTMYQAVEAVMNQNKETVNTLPALAEAATGFSQSIAGILQRNQEHLGVAQGAIAAKNNSLDDCVEHAFRLGNAIYALGRKTNNEQFKSGIYLAQYEIERMRETDIVQYCSRIADLAKECPADFTSGAIIAQEIEGLNKALDTYHQQAGTKEVKIAESKASRKSLSESFDKADEILKSDIDTLVEVIKTSNDDFYKQYQAARSIRDLGGHVPRKKKPVETPKTVPLAIAAAA